MRVLGLLIGHLVFRYRAGFGIEFADVMREISGKPDLAFAIRHQAMRTGVFHLEGIFFECSR
jgi:hypothetical protein